MEINQEFCESRYSNIREEIKEARVESDKKHRFTITTVIALLSVLIVSVWINWASLTNMRVDMGIVKTKVEDIQKHITNGKH